MVTKFVPLLSAFSSITGAEVDARYTPGSYEFGLESSPLGWVLSLNHNASAMRFSSRSSYYCYATWCERFSSTSVNISQPNRSSTRANKEIL